MQIPDINNLPADITQPTDPNKATAAVFWDEPTGIDNSGQPVTLTSNPVSGSNFGIGFTIVWYNVTDVYGNTRTAIFVVTVEGNYQVIVSNLKAFTAYF